MTKTARLQLSANAARNAVRTSTYADSVGHTQPLSTAEFLRRLAALRVSTAR